MFVVFDLDGTLADIGHRVHHVRGGNRNYDAFFAECINDLPNVPVVAALNAHWDAGHRVEIWSARSDKVRAETVDWLIAQKIDPRLLVNMRPAGDSTRDVELKRSWLHALHPDERPDLVYDDRQSVVDMWRAEGLACFQVIADWETDAAQIIPPTQDPLLTIMVGPSGGGKSSWIAAARRPEEVISSDALRLLYTGGEGDQSRNEDVFVALHRLARARLECGLPVTIDATNLRRKDRLACVALAPAGVGVRYVVVNRPMALKVRDAGRRAGVVMADGKSLIEAHEQRFQSQLKDILRGDGLPQVTVVDARITDLQVAA
ncbi:AAA family ATPase [Devosia neptuniae]|uniref:AAA family ATPase n=1 Tax=Devosia neptuniae TaxID=191302 RepID=A0ABY6CF51_9HYPH|nr:AAA family ATPase [Devosia neptuniae]UXN70863.1 AAA family ATPase [Devosia neptuniae]